MTSVQEYVRKLSREQLERMLWDYCEGSDRYDAVTILSVCTALAEYDNSKPDPHEAFRHLCRQYLP